MTAQIKQRIVGIVVLSFLALIILPWLFGSNQPAVFLEKSGEKEKLKTNELPEKKPIPDNFKPVVNSYQIDNKPMPSTVESSSAKITEPTQKFSNNNDQVIPSTSELNLKMTEIQNDIIRLPAATKLIEEKKIKPKASSEKLKKIKFAKNERIKAVAAPAHKNWTIQMGSFNNKNNADNLIRKLKEKGYSAYSRTTTKTQGETITRVFVGPQENHFNAEKLLKKIEGGFKIHGVIIKATA